MLFEFIYLEISRAFKSPMVYVFTLLVTILIALAVGTDSIVIGESIGNVYRNAPHVVTNFSLYMGLFGLLFAAAFFNNAVLRDYTNQFNEILFSTPIKKLDFFLGRFLGALFLSTIPLVGVFLGVLLGSWLGPILGDLDPERISAIPWNAFVSNYLIFVLPNMFFAGAIIFGMANLWKNTTVTFLGAFLILVGYIISLNLLSDIENEALGALVDPFGLSAYNVYSRYFTPLEKNTQVPVLEGLLLANRALWLGIGIFIMGLSYARFSFKKKNAFRFFKRKKDQERILYTRSQSLPSAVVSFGKGIHFQQFLSLYKINFLYIVKSNVFKILLVIGLFMLELNIGNDYDFFGLQSYPVTYEMIDQIRGIGRLFTFIILIFFCGELIWKDRLSKINEVIDATPHQSRTSLLAKGATLVSIVTLLEFAFMIYAMFYQLRQGYTHLEVGLYLKYFLLYSLPTFLFWTGFLIFIQVMVNHRYIAYFVSILLMFLWDLVLTIADVGSNMVDLGSAPSMPYSDMNGFGPAVLGTIWFKGYWLLVSILLLLTSSVLWVRGQASSWKDRINKAGPEIRGGQGKLILGVLAIWIVTAGFIFYNTQILNPYQTSDYWEKRQVDYEKTYKKYEGVAQPSITDVNYEIDIFPGKRDVRVKAEMQLINKTNVPIDTIFFSIDKDWHPEIVISGAQLALDDERLDFRKYALKEPLTPGQSFSMTIHTNYTTSGFENEISNSSVLENGTFLNNMEVLPSIGYNAGLELQDKNTRKKYDLQPRLRMPKLTADCNDLCKINYLSDGKADWVNVSTIISTSADQIAIAPGSLIKEWTKENRNYYEYKVDRSSQYFFSFISARFAVAKKQWKDISMEVYYHPTHAVNVEGMLDAIQKSLEYYSTNFGPYHHKQARIIEFPRYASFAQAFPGTMPYSESLGFITNLEEESGNNVVEAVIAHEMGHQWWAHQEIPANMQGGTMLTESFAEYSSLMVMKQESDPLKMKDFLKYDHNRYLRGRSSERIGELPLYLVENQGHIHYGKGSVIMYALQDFIGEEKVNGVLRSFLEEYRYAEPPYPTSLDFLRHLNPVVPDSLKYLIEDWFKTITLYDLRLKKSEYAAVAGGKFEVTLEIEALKLKADSIGNETEVPIADWIDVGVFADQDEKDLIYQKRVRIDTEKKTLTFTVDKKPAKAVIDPFRILIEREIKDNSKSVQQKDV